MSESETKSQITRLATRISIAAINLFAKHYPAYFESKNSESFCVRLQEDIRKVTAEFFDEQKSTEAK